MDRRELTERILQAKRRKGVSFAALAEEVGADRVWLTAALLGQHPLTEEQARKVRSALDLPEEAAAPLQEVTGTLQRARRGNRPYEVLQVYGPAIKALIHEDFGDGIMSAISFNLAVGREESADGPRVQITLNGKFLPYKW